ERLLLAPHEVGGRGDGTRGQRMISAEDEREPALFEDAERRLVQLFADARDLADVFLTRIAERLDFRNRRDEIPFIDHRDAKRRQTFGETADAKRRRSHVDAAAVAAEIERDADDVHGRHRAPVYRFG